MLAGRPGLPVSLCLRGLLRGLLSGPQTRIQISSLKRSESAQPPTPSPVRPGRAAGTEPGAPVICNSASVTTHFKILKSSKIERMKAVLGSRSPSRVHVPNVFGAGRPPSARRCALSPALPVVCGDPCPCVILLSANTKARGSQYHGHSCTIHQPICFPRNSERGIQRHTCSYS